MKKVVLIGLRADVVDFSKWPELSKEKLEAAFDVVLKELNENGYDAEWCLTDTGKTAEDQVRKILVSKKPDIVLVGAGVRTDPDHFLLFERLVNLIHKYSPNAKIAFNSLPHDSLQAVQRWT